MTAEEQREIIDRLHTGQYSCIVCNGNEIRYFSEKGVKDLYRLLREEPEFLSGAFVADKVIGKAAAALMILAGVKKVFAHVVSLPGFKLLEQAHIPVEYTKIVPHIINRTQTAWCPLEKKCAPASTPQACLVQIEDFITMLKNKK